MAYFLCLLVTTTMYIRPGEMFPALYAVPIYETLILAGLAVGFTQVAGRLTQESLTVSPISVCVLGMLVAVVLSHLTHFNLWGARFFGAETLKVTLYYFLLVSVVDSLSRLRFFLWTLLLLGLVIISIALLQYHDIINLPAFEPVEEREYDPVQDEEHVIRRLAGTGIFHDPNDLSVVIVVTAVLCLFAMGGRRQASILRPFWLAPFGLCLFALAKTQSRGGFIALLAAMLALLVSRFGWKKTLPLVVIGLPLVVLLLGGRQTSISTSEDTGQERIQMWSEALIVMRQAPLFGIGRNEFVEETGLVVHNSYLQCYVELGFFGGTLFVGIFYLAFTSLRAIASCRQSIADPEMRRAIPYLSAIMVGLGTSILTISRPYVVSTYVIFGLMAAFIRVASDGGAVVVPRLDAGLVGRVVKASVVFLVVMYCFVRYTVRFG